MAYACVCVYYDYMSCAQQVQDVLVNYMLAVDILVTKIGKTFEKNYNLSLLHYFDIPASIIHWCLQTLIHCKNNIMRFA